jgi:hypothetical protein
MRDAGGSVSCCQSVSVEVGMLEEGFEDMVVAEKQVKQS